MRGFAELRDPWALLIAALAAVAALALTAPWQVAVGGALAVLFVRVAAGLLLAPAPAAAAPVAPVALPAPTTYGSGPGGAITRREYEVAELVHQGLRNREIAERLFISTDTVENHVQHIFDKLDFHTRSQIAAWWAERHLSKK